MQDMSSNNYRVFRSINVDSLVGDNHTTIVSLLESHDLPALFPALDSAMGAYNGLKRNAIGESQANGGANNFNNGYIRIDTAKRILDAAKHACNIADAIHEKCKDLGKISIGYDMILNGLVYSHDRLASYAQLHKHPTADKVLFECLPVFTIKQNMFMSEWEASFMKDISDNVLNEWYDGCSAAHFIPDIQPSALEQWVEQAARELSYETLEEKLNHAQSRYTSRNRQNEFDIINSAQQLLFTTYVVRRAYTLGRWRNTCIPYVLPDEIQLERACAGNMPIIHVLEEGV